MALDASGNLYIADNGNNRIRKVDTNGIISTVAGGGSTSSTPGTAGGHQRQPECTCWLRASTPPAICISPTNTTTAFAW